MSGMEIWRAAALFVLPLLLAAWGVLIAGRGGVWHFGLEGAMVLGALTGGLLLSFLDGLYEAGRFFAPYTLAVLAAAAVSGLTGAAYSLLLSLAAVRGKADQAVSGTAFHGLSAGIAAMILQNRRGRALQLPAWALAVGEKSWVVPAAVLVLLLASALFFRTKAGLRLRACGEDPFAAARLGVNVCAVRDGGMMISGCLGGLGGLAFLFAAGGRFQISLAGLGILALGAAAAGRWRVIAAAAISLFLSVLWTAGEGALFSSLAGVANAASIYKALPFLTLLFLLALTGRRKTAVRAIGTPWHKNGEEEST